MGQRAVVAFKKNDVVKVTTVQWATVAPAVWAKAANIIMTTQGVDFTKAVNFLAETITSYEHISALEVGNTDYVNGYGKSSLQLSGYNENDEIVLLSGANKATEEFPVETIENITTHEELKKIVENHYHAQDGISVIVDGDTEEAIVEFFMDSDYGNFGFKRHNEHNDYFVELTEDNMNTYVDNNCEK